jgi:hypothetical protein
MNGNVTNYIEKDGEYKCKYYYLTDSLYNPLPSTYKPVTYITTNGSENYYTECSKLGTECQIGRIAKVNGVQSLIYSQYSDGTNAQGIISGYRIDNPMGTGSDAKYLLIDNISDIGLNNPYQYKNIDSVEDCQNICSQEYTYSDGVVVPGGYCFKYDSNNKICWVNYSKPLDGSIPTFIKSS